jgi:hypothetical protein
LVVSRSAATNRPASATFPCGTRVRVRNTLGSWAGGFEVVSVDRAGYLLRRVSDGALLPMPIGATEVREG